MTTQRCYRCPEHPDKVYTSWRKFRGHWSTLHRGEECPPREEFLEMIEKEERIEEKKERKEIQKEEAVAREYPGEERTPGEFILPEDPVPRLAKILEVHGAPPEAVAQILGVFQIHPGYQNNPVNLHYLLTAKLNRRLHSSIPMIISAFQSQDPNYPEGSPMMMMPGMGGQPMMPPYMMGGGYPQFYPPPMGYPPMYRQPMGGREPSEEERPRRREKETSPIEDAVALLTTMMTLKDKLIPSTGDSSSSVQEIFEGFRSTIEELTKDSKEQQDKLLEKLEAGEEKRRADIEGIKEQLHHAETGRLEDRISALQESKDDERSEGLGSLLKEAGEGLGTQVDGLRQSVTQGVEKLGSLAEKIVSVEITPGLPTKKGSAEASRTVGSAAELIEAEEEVAALSKILEEGQ